MKVINLLTGQTSTLGDDWTVTDFRPEAPEPARMTPTHAGIIPDRAAAPAATRRHAGLFSAGEMAQNIVTRIVNFHLDAVVFATEPPMTLVRNLHATVDPDLHSGLAICQMCCDR